VAIHSRVERLDQVRDLHPRGRAGGSQRRVLPPPMCDGGAVKAVRGSRLLFQQTPSAQAHQTAQVARREKAERRTAEESVAV
jgi:hypothetical protein